MASESMDTVKVPSSRRSSSVSRKQVQGLSVDQVKESLLRLLPDHQDFVNEHIIKPLCMSDLDCAKVQELLNENLERGLNKDTHEEAMVKMYPTYVRDIPDGSETGKFLALDFGGVNFRVLLVTLRGVAAGTDPSIDSKNGLVPDRLLGGPGDKLFDHIVALLHKFLKGNDLLNTPDPIPLGFTFSFTCHQYALNKAILRAWAKQFHCDGVVGEDVVKLLEDAIKRKGDMNVEVLAVASDTVGTLMSGALKDKKTAIGYILGKGSNACYIEHLDKVGTWDGDMDETKQIIINTEWRSFGKDGCLDFIRSEYDHDIDEHSKHPGSGTFEKMMAGSFLGELVRLILNKMKDKEVLFDEHWTPELETKGRFYTKYISEVLSEEDIRFRNTRHVFADVHLHEASEQECQVVHHICQLASDRAATLAAIGLACLINRVGRPEVAIAVDGALFRFHPLFHELLKEKIPKYLKEETEFWFVPSDDGSGKGAAVVAAVAQRMNRHSTPQK